MRHQDDFILLHLRYFGTRPLPLEDLGLEWPPPEFIVFDGENMREAIATDARAEMWHRERFSQITDEQIATMDHVVRGAEYRYVEDVNYG